MRILSKLSAELLAGAFTAAESFSYVVFAVVGQEKVLQVLGRVVKALRIPHSGRGSLWGSTFVKDDKVEDNCIVLVCVASEFPQLDDYPRALDTIIEYDPSDPLPLYNNEVLKLSPDVWGLKIRLA